jgi:hypothetical protein
MSLRVGWVAREERGMVPVVLLLALISMQGLGCDTAQEEPTRTFRVEYRVEGSFIGCSVFYITRGSNIEPDQVNQGGEVVHTHESLPWSTEFDVTVAPGKSFIAQVNASCASATAETVQVSLYVDGALRKQADATDVEADLTTVVALTMDG